MLTFTSLGGSAVRCKNGGMTLVVYPQDGEKADLMLLQNPEEDPQEGTISWPGEYDYGGVAIRGIGHGEGQKVSYAVEVEGLRYAFLASPLEEWSDHDLELLGDIDILFLPADNEKIAQKLIDQIDPRMLIPLPTKDKETFEEVLKTCGARDKSPESELKVRGKSSLRAEGREVVILKPAK